MHLYYQGKAEPLDELIRKYGREQTVIDVDGKAHRLIVDPSELSAAYARMTKKQRQRRQERYAVEVD